MIWERCQCGEESVMRRILQTCGVAAAVVALIGVNVPVTGAQGIVSGIEVPNVSTVTIGGPAGMPIGLPAGVSVSVPTVPSTPIMAGIGVGIAGTATSSKGHVTQKESNTVEEATIVMGE